MGEEMKDRYSISADELESRMALNEEKHVDPARKAAFLLEEALGKVLSKLGVDITKEQEDIHLQMELAGIHVNTIQTYPGIFITTSIPQVEPFAWVSDAILDSSGAYAYEIHWFREERMEETLKVKAL